jgi:hypothetical protein
MKTMNVLTIIDGIVGSLSRGGPGREVVLSFKAGKLPTWFTPSVGNLLGLEKTTTNEWKLPGESAYDALWLARAFLEVLNDSIPKVGLLPMEDQFGFFLKMREWPREKFIKFAKFATAWPMARYLHQELPETPEGFPSHPLIVGGKLRRILKNRLISFNDKNSRLWAGYLQGVKRGASPVSEDFVHEAMIKHREILSTPPAGDDEVVTGLEPLVERVLQWYKPPKPELFEASTSAAFESKRSEGGARGYIRERYAELSGHNQLLEMVETRPGVVVEVRGTSTPTFDEVLDWASESPTDVMVSAVLEPLKVRLISKGSAPRYYISKFKQKGMWKYLQRFVQFSPTGRLLDVSDLHGILSREQKLNLEFDQWVSGDYSGATDRVDLRVTELIFNKMLEKSDYSDHLKDVLRSVIGAQRLHYPESMNREGELDSIDQRNGQLMGSPLSFPILCLINLVAYWGALEEYLGRRVSIKNLPVLINGDDILFRANTEFYEVWKRWVHKVGFVLSLGKNYIHPRLLTINSQLYRWNPEEVSFRYLGFMNTGLLTGQSKITGRMNARLAPIWAYYNEVVPFSVSPERAHRRFVHYHRENLEKFTNRGEFNLFLPFHRGGLGFSLDGHKPRITSFQRRFATYLEKEYRQQVSEGVEPKGETVGLVRESPLPNSPVTFFHHPRLLMEPTIGPLKEGVVLYKPREMIFPILSQPMETERPEFRVRLPKRSKKRFRANPSARMGDREIFSWPWRLCEDTLWFTTECATQGGSD